MTSPSATISQPLGRTSGFTLAAQVVLRDDVIGEQPLATISGPDGSELVRVVLRQAGASPELRGWDEQQQNYLRWAGRDGTVTVLEAVVAIAIDAPCRMGLPRNARVGIPVVLAGSGARRVLLRLRPGKLDLFVDDHLVDEEWPAGGLGAAATRAEAWSGSSGLVLHPVAKTDAELGLRPDYGGPVGAMPEHGPQYWHPPGHNRWAGDTMVFHDGERLHLMYLIDRRHHGSKGGCGAHQIAHLTTRDLRTWESHPLALPIDEAWEAIGTGSMVKHAGRWHILYGLHSERIVERAALTDGSDTTLPRSFGDLGGRRPVGCALASSDDGIAFTKQDLLVHAAQNPSVFDDPRGGFWMLAGEGAYGLYRSEDLRSWTAVDHFIVPYGEHAPARNTCECMCHLEWNGWHYLMGGWTGFWMSRDVAGPYWDQDSEAGRRAAAAVRAHSGPQALNPRPSGVVGKPRWDIFDGLGVPMVTAMPDGRRILAGWLMDRFGWAGCLVLRELHQEADGTLAMSWLPETVPAGGAPLALAWTDGTADGLPAACLIDLTVTPQPGGGRFAIVVGSCCLVLDAARRQAQWGTPRQGELPLPLPSQASLTGDAAGRHGPHVACHARDFAIDGVEGLDATLRIRLVVMPDRKSGTTIVDAEIGGRRTMITRRRDAMDGGRIRIVAEGAAPRLDHAEVRPLADRPL